jgi:UDP-N-acetyl-D-galactosamine dehydrogenase
MMGITFKENCPDVRNTKVVNVITALCDYGIAVEVFDPLANPATVEHEYGLKTREQAPTDKFDAVVLAVAHKEFENINLKQFVKPLNIVYDVKGILGEQADGTL